jgi:ADP-ribosyl-[dinitrogen reductase] hydrolase
MSLSMIDIVLDRAIQERARGAMVGLAIGDALGAPVEFKDRDSFPEVREMLAGGYFKLPAGAWTDDTAMALCLADSLIHDSDLDARDLLNRFLGWIYANENTSNGQCIGVGQNTFAVLGNYRRTGALTAPPIKGRSDGNGALMRLAPVACRHWADPTKARLIARSQSYTTHASELSAAACDAVAAILCDLIAGQPWQDALSGITNDIWPEEIRTILAGSWNKPRNEILSSGYVVHTLEAALWAVGTTANFEEALIAAVNLGNDADTVGAVAGQLAGARYGIRAVPSRWSDMLIDCDKIDIKARNLITASGGPLTGLTVPKDKMEGML